MLNEENEEMEMDEVEEVEEEEEEEEKDMAELVEAWCDKNGHTFEMESGLRRFEKLIKDVDCAYHNIEEFLLDNPGAIEAMVNWIGEQNVPHWKQNLQDVL